MNDPLGETGPDASSGAVTEDADPEFEALLRGVAAAPAMASTGFAVGPGDEIEGYQIVERIGQGGMGVVFRAIDPKLDRTVAIKLHRGAANPVQTQRLVREARTMAQLNHANVVAVFDVGTHDGAVFIAMEYIDGSLRDWLVAEQRPWPEIVAVFVQAARGLAAAHELGITHRDFKPDNVLLDPQGRARVADFGLAIPTDADSTQPTTAESAAAHASSSHVGSEPSASHAGRLTRTNTTVGTPAYMAPEQYGGTEITPAADQFSFCVSLYEALYGARPFCGDSPGELLSSVVRGEIQTPTATDVPGFVLAVLTRGLKPQPEDRFATMGALIAALPHTPTRARRQWVGGGVLVAAGLGASAWGLAGDEAPMCAGAQAQLGPAWGADRKAAIRRAFERSSLPHAPATLEGAQSRLTAYAQAWTSGYLDACRATHVQATQSVEHLDLRMRCLVRSRDALAAVASVLEAADDATINKTPSLLEQLPSLAACLDAEVLAQGLAPPTAELAATVEAARTDRATCQALITAGSLETATPLVEELVLRTEAIPYAPLQVEVAQLHARLLNKQGHRRQAGKKYEAAFWQAVELGYHARIPGLGLQAAFIIAQHLNDEDRAEKILRRAQASAQHADVPRFVENVEHFYGMLAMKHGDEAEAERRFAQQLQLAENSSSPSETAIIDAMSNLAMAEDQNGRFAVARERHKRALSLRLAMVGPTHPDLAWLNRRLAIHFMRRDDAVKALPYFESAQKAAEANKSVDPRKVASALSDLAMVYGLVHRPQDAIEASKGAVQIMEAAGDTSSHRFADLLVREAQPHLNTSECEKYLPSIERAQQIAEAQEGGSAPLILNALLGRANCLRTLGRLSEGLELTTRALASPGTGRAHLPIAWSAHARLLAKAGRHAEALAAADSGLDANHRMDRQAGPAEAVLWSTRATALIGLKRIEEALEAGAKAVDAARALGPKSHHLLTAQLAHAERLAEHGRVAEARPLAEAVRGHFLEQHDDPTSNALYRDAVALLRTGAH